MLTPDYDDDPGRWAANQEATRTLVGKDVHEDVARGFTTHRRVLDIGGGDGALARFLHAMNVDCVVVDTARHVRRAPRPAVQADARRLPFPDDTFDGAAALWMLYHLPDPLVALREARRVLRQGGMLVVSTSSRFNDPELATGLPNWGAPGTFDAENAEQLLAQVFADIKVRRWDTPLARLPDRAALELFLRGRGLTVADAAAVDLPTPMTVTKRGPARVGSLILYSRTVRPYREVGAMRKHVVSVGVGAVMLAVGLVLYLVFADVETPVIGMRQAGLVLAVLGAIELVVSGFALVRPQRR